MTELDRQKEVEIASCLLDDYYYDNDMESKRGDFRSRLLKWLFPSRTVGLVGIGKFRGTVTRAEWDENEIPVSSFLSSRLSALGSDDLRKQPLLNKYILLSLAASGNSKKLVQLSQSQRLLLYLRVLFERTTLHDFFLCASLLRGQSLVVDGEYYNVRIIDLGRNKG